MACEHKRVKSVNCVLYCMDCGARVDGERPLPSAQALPPSPKEEGSGKAKRTRTKSEAGPAEG